MEHSAQLLTPTLSRPKLTTNGDELPEAVVLEDAGAAMAGFVGLLRQLGFEIALAAEVFHGLHNQATAVSTRAIGLTVGAQRIEAQLPLIEERFRRRRSARPCFLQQQDVAVACSNSVLSSGIRSEGLCGVAGHGVDRRRPSAWLVNHSVIVVGGTKSRSMAEHIRRCRGPPQLSLLDKYDTCGEGACLKRYTDPSFFRAQSAKHELFLQEAKPKLQSSHKCSKFKTDALLDTLRQLKYRHIIGRIRRQMHSSHNQDSPEDEASEAHVLSPSDSPETSNTKVPCPSVPVNKERSSVLVQRTSSFGAWLSPDAASTHASDIIQETNADGFASHGANKADENANIATNARSALIDFIASRVESSPRKLSVRKHSDPLTESFRNMAKKVLLENESAHSSQRTSEF
ncbi:hypothetical protein CFC21_027889 [Triticum aestivum]|uniref:Protein SCAR n=2 Tax=Triticum aestivum TaxID=4565 RepID=A0A3B6D6A9_WHEAT|nr:hypothetical protein CFC21_027889 [Triticum aestivum]